MKIGNEIIKKIFLSIAGVLVSLLLSEIISRIFIPVFPGASLLSLDGTQLNISKNHPGAIYRQYSQEYDALTTITSKGYRVPEVINNPDIVFIGDSFTFGQGLSDQETFVYDYCQSLDISCANLGVPGASTVSEIDRLETFLINENWTPKQVCLFITVMTQFMGAGNDLYDNWIADTRQTPEPLDKTSNIESKKSYNILMRSDIKKMILRYCNLARVIKYYWGPLIKKHLAPSPEKAMLKEMLNIMKFQLIRLDNLSKKYNFEYQIFLIHPIQDILRGSHKDTIMEIGAIAPKEIESTAHLFINDTEQYYFSLDGHLNSKGSKKIADFLKIKYLKNQNEIQQ